MRRFIIVALVALAVLTGCRSTAEDYMSVSVSGSATVTLTPDMASFSISVSETGQTTREAQQQANAKMQDIYDILHEGFGIVAEDIRTTSMSLYPEYRYEDGQQILVGQTASQSISVTVHRLDDLALIVDRLSSVTGISLSSISLDASEKDESMSQARRLAMQDAMDKAGDYAEAAGFVLGAPVSVSESGSYHYANRVQPTMLMAGASAKDEASSASYYAGDLGVSAEVNVVFRMH